MLFTVAGCKPKDEPVNNPSQPSSQEEVTHPIDPAIQKDVDLLIARYILPYETTLRGQAFSNVSQIPDRLLYRYAMGIVDSVFVSEDFLLHDLKGENSYHAIPDDLITEIIKLDFDLDGFLYNKALYYDDSQGVYDRGNWYVIEGTTEVFAREAKLLDNGDIWILVGRRAGNHDLDSVEYVFRPQKPLGSDLCGPGVYPFRWGLQLQFCIGDPPKGYGGLFQGCGNLHPPAAGGAV